MIPHLPIERIGLFFDVDGTLIDIAERPQDVIVPRSLLNVLKRTEQALQGALALVSGRTIAELDRLFDPLHLSASGVHGAELRLRSGDAAVKTSEPLPRALIDGVQAVGRRFDGTIVEDKQFSVAVHFRQAPQAEKAIRTALDSLLQQNQNEGLKILPGHMVFDIKRATFDKGTAIRQFMDHDPFAGRIPVFLGDDVTDKPGFDAVLQMGGFAFSIGQAFPGVSGSFPNPDSVRRWLAGLVQAETSQE